VGSNGGGGGGAEGGGGDDDDDMRETATEIPSLAPERET
jgi:hypothetical protein